MLIVVFDLYKQMSDTLVCESNVRNVTVNVLVKCDCMTMYASPDLLHPVLITNTLRYF